jgi:hypothetical protein
MYHNSVKTYGIEVYSQQHRCSLATTFRSLPDPNILRSNDTVLRTLNLKLETSCTTSASPASARLFLVESKAPKNSRRIAENTQQEKSFADIAVDHFQCARDYFEARDRLWRFRKYHAHLQEEAVGTVINGVEGEAQTFDLWKLGILLCSLHLAIWTFDTLARQRRSTEADQTLEERSLQSINFGGLFTLCHLFIYYAAGMKMLQSSRAAALISLYSLTGYVMQRI